MEVLGGAIGAHVGAITDHIMHILILDTINELNRIDQERNAKARFTFGDFASDILVSSQHRTLRNHPVSGIEAMLSTLDEFDKDTVFDQKCVEIP